MVDAAGAIYVIGGFDGDTDYNDVWASADGGARAGLAPGVTRGDTGWVLRGYYRGTRGVLEGYYGASNGTYRVLGPPRGYLGGT